MDYTGKRVLHKSFGEGMITGVKGEYIYVKFSSGQQKYFVYPACFQSFLKLLDAEAAAAATGELRKIEDAAQKRKTAALKQEELRHLERMKKEAAYSGDVIAAQFSSAGEFFESYRASLIREISYLRTNGGKRQKVFDGKFVENRNNRYIYTFESEEELNLSEGTQIVIWRSQNSINGTIECCEEFTVIISCSEDLGREVSVLEFSAESWRLIQYLIDRLDEMRQTPSGIVSDLICNGFKNIDFSASHIATGQDAAVQMSTNQPITFIWGPPGTGKTQTLAKISLEHIRRGNRVLMLSYSNVSVDGAILRVHKLSTSNTPGLLVRYGYPRVDLLKKHDYLTTYNLVIRNHPELMKERLNLGLV